jgi:hypothetical protein
MKSESNHASPIPDQTNSLNGISAYGNFEVGFGRGRLEYVTDAVAANFLLQDLRSKLGIEYNARDIEQLANNITKIRNQRYFDFRFGRIKQLELLNEALTGLGIENVGIEYFNTINDNWLSATRLNRFSGSMWTYSLAGRLWGTNTKSENVQQFQTNMFTSYQMNGTQVYYIGPAIEYQKYHQTSQNTQIAWGGKLSSGINFRENKFLSFKDSMALPSDMGSPSVSLSDDWLNQLQLNCSYLFQPNSRTFLTINVSPNIAWRESWQELRFTGIPESRTAIQSNVATSLNYFRFINQRLTYTIGLNVNAMNSRNFNRTFRGLIESSQSTILYGIDAGVTYQLF